MRLILFCSRDLGQPLQVRGQAAACQMKSPFGGDHHGASKSACRATISYTLSRVPPNWNTFALAPLLSGVLPLSAGPLPGVHAGLSDNLSPAPAIRDRRSRVLRPALGLIVPVAPWSKQETCYRSRSGERAGEAIFRVLPLPSAFDGPGAGHARRHGELEPRRRRGDGFFTALDLGTVVWGCATRCR